MYKDVWETNINVSPENFSLDKGETILTDFNRVRNQKYVKIGDASYLLALMHRSKGGFCDLALAPDRFFKSSYAMATNKNFPYVRRFNKK